MSTERNLDFAFSRDLNRMVEVTEVRNGLKCNCECPACKTRLIAKKRGKMRRPHFAHYTAQAEDVACHTGRETSLHMMAKQVIAELQEFCLPQFTVSASFRLVTVEKTTPGTLLQVVRSQLPDQEPWGGGRRPDVILHGESMLLWVEVKVSNGVDDDKAAVIREQQIPTIEVDLSHIPDPYGRTKETIGEYIKTSPCICSWVFHPEEERLRKEAEVEARIKLAEDTPSRLRRAATSPQNATELRRRASPLA